MKFLIYSVLERSVKDTKGSYTNVPIFKGDIIPEIYNPVRLFFVCVLVLVVLVKNLVLVTRDWRRRPWLPGHRLGPPRAGESVQSWCSREGLWVSESDLMKSSQGTCAGGWPDHTSY